MSEDGKDLIVERRGSLNVSDGDTNVIEHDSPYAAP